MSTIYEKSVKDRKAFRLGASELQSYSLNTKREQPLLLPESSEIDVVRHYTNLSKKIYSVDSGFYPLGSCTMKYNPKINEDIASLDGFKNLHPLQDLTTVPGAIKVFQLANTLLKEITGMDQMTFQPAAGAQGELASLLMIKKYHQQRNDTNRNVVIVPDSAHGTNPASANMAGFKVKTVPSKNGTVDLEALKGMVDETTAALMLTNPNTLGLFEKDILEIEKLIHDNGGLMYCDGANMNAIMGTVRPGDIGFDVIHLNLHKTFSTPHGGGGPGCGAVGVKASLLPYLPTPFFNDEGVVDLQEHSIGAMKNFYGHFLVVVRALTYILSLGQEGIQHSSQLAVLNANYLYSLLDKRYQLAQEVSFMHEFVLNLSNIKKDTGVSALDLSKGLIDHGIHPPTMYFPLSVPQALMVEPTETESKETLVMAANAFNELADLAYENPEALHEMPIKQVITRVDEVKAARQPIIIDPLLEAALR